MRIVFLGTPDFAVPCLGALVEAGHDVVGVVARPDQPRGRGQRVQPPPTIERARALCLETRQPRAIKEGPFPEWMESLEADVGVVIAYGRILTPRLLRAPKRGCINVHASLLPKYRGAAPIQWSVIQGEAETGVCTMQMDEGLDTGDVLLEARTPIGPHETSGELWSRLAELGAPLLIETLAALDRIEPRPQNHSAHTLAPMLTKAHGYIDWSASAQRVHDLVRGVNPWPGGQATFREAPFKVLRTRVNPGPHHGAPGEVLSTSPLVIACGGGAVELLEVQAPGKRRTAGVDHANGARVQPGERLGSPVTAEGPGPDVSA